MIHVSRTIIGIVVGIIASIAVVGTGIGIWYTSSLQIDIRDYLPAAATLVFIDTSREPDIVTWKKIAPSPFWDDIPRNTNEIFAILHNQNVLLGYTTVENTENLPPQMHRTHIGNVTIVSSEPYEYKKLPTGALASDPTFTTLEEHKAPDSTWIYSLNNSIIPMAYIPATTPFAASHIGTSILLDTMLTHAVCPDALANFTSIVPGSQKLITGNIACALQNSTSYITRGMQQTVIARLEQIWSDTIGKSSGYFTLLPIANDALQLEIMQSASGNTIFALQGTSNNQAAVSEILQKIHASTNAKHNVGVVEPYTFDTSFTITTLQPDAKNKIMSYTVGNWQIEQTIANSVTLHTAQNNTTWLISNAPLAMITNSIESAENNVANTLATNSTLHGTMPFFHWFTLHADVFTHWSFYIYNQIERLELIM